MPVYADSFFPKRANTNFIIRNTSPSRKKIRVFTYPINYGESRDLMAIPIISEADIRHSLLKGELLERLLNHDIQIIESSIDLLSFDPEQKAFLEEQLKIILTNLSICFSYNFFSL